ncbi:MAG: hypothetical protein BGO59_09035 [Spirosoma sp. 48-14]|nr:MAG: hypothetical protein BGO59_09035 [Spirosoma sp. 48-14]
MTAILNLLACLLLAVSAGLAATTYVNTLTQPGMILAFWAKWLYSLQTYFITHGKSWTERDDHLLFQTGRYKVSEYLLKPILSCVFCVGGQMGFWLSLYYKLQYDTNFSIILCALTAVLSVWFGGAFQSIQQKYFPL